MARSKNKESMRILTWPRIPLQSSTTTKLGQSSFSAKPRTGGWGETQARSAYIFLSLSRAVLLTFSLFLISLIIPTRTSTLMLYTQFQNHFPKFYNFPSGNPLLLFNPTPPQEHVSFPSPLPSQSQPNVTVLNKINTISIRLLKLIIPTRGNIWRNIYSYCETIAFAFAI